MAAAKFSTKVSMKSSRVKSASRLPSVKIPSSKKDYSKRSKKPSNDFNLSFGLTGLTGRS